MVGSMDIFFWLRKPKGFGPDLFWANAPSTSSGTFGPTLDIGLVIILFPAIHEFLETKTKTTVGPSQVGKAVTHASNNPVTRMQSLSLRTAILKRKSLKMAPRAGTFNRAKAQLELGGRRVLGRNCSAANNPVRQGTLSGTLVVFCSVQPGSRCTGHGMQCVRHRQPDQACTSWPHDINPA